MAIGYSLLKLSRICFQTPTSLFVIPYSSFLIPLAPCPPATNALHLAGSPLRSDLQTKLYICGLEKIFVHIASLHLPGLHQRIVPIGQVASIGGSFQDT